MCHKTLSMLPSDRRWCSPAELVDFGAELLVVLADLGDFCPGLVLWSRVDLPPQVEPIPQCLQNEPPSVSAAADC